MGLVTRPENDARYLDLAIQKMWQSCRLFVVKGENENTKLSVGTSFFRSSCLGQWVEGGATLKNLSTKKKFQCRCAYKHSFSKRETRDGNIFKKR